MSTRNSLLIIALLIVLTLGVSLILGNQLPEQDGFPLECRGAGGRLQ